MFLHVSVSHSVHRGDAPGGCLVRGVPGPGGCLLRGVPGPGGGGAWHPHSYWNALLFDVRSVNDVLPLL